MDIPMRMMVWLTLTTITLRMRSITMMSMLESSGLAIGSVS